MSFDFDILKDCDNEPVREIIAICDDVVLQLKSIIRIADCQKALLVAAALVEEIVEAHGLSFSGVRPPASGDENKDCQDFNAYIELARLNFKAQHDELIIKKTKEQYKELKGALVF